MGGRTGYHPCLQLFTSAAFTPHKTGGSYCSNRGMSLIRKSIHKSCESETLFFSAMIPPLSPGPKRVRGMLFNSNSRAGTACLDCLFLSKPIICCVFYMFCIYQIHSAAREWI